MMSMLIFLGYALLAVAIFLVFVSKNDLNHWVTTTSAIVLGLVFGLIGWLVMPVINVGFPVFWSFVFMLLFLCWGVPSIFMVFSDEELSSRNKGMLLGAVILMIVWLLWLLFSTSPAFRSSDYAQLMVEPRESRFSDDVSPVDIKKVRQVDGGLAQLLAAPLLGDIPGLGSRVSIGEMNIQVINGTFDVMDGSGRELRLSFENDLVWAGPLNHSGPFKQLAHGTTPGYVMVSAIDPGEVYLVTAIKSQSEKENDGNVNPRMGDTMDGGFEKVSLRFTAGAYFDSKLKRYLYANGYLGVGFTDLTFEVRDDGRPFFVATRFDKKVGFSGNEAVGVVVVDPQTGSIEEYSIDDAPEWIDRIQPEDFVRDQLDWRGAYSKGWLNSWIGRDGVQETTPGMSLVFAADGRSYWYTGMQSAGADKSTMGFILTDTRNKRSSWYQISGATEVAAKEAAEAAPSVREAEFKATNPILYSIIGEPTYFMALKGDDGLVKMFALVNVRSYQVLGTGKSVAAALRDYQSALISAGRSLDADDIVGIRSIEAIVKDVAIEDGFYYLLLEGSEGKEFYAGSALSRELKWTRPGHRVVIEVQEGDGTSVSVIKFINLDIEF